MRLVFQPVELITGFEPVTSSLPRKCSTYWAIWAYRHNLLAPPFLFGAGSENRTRVISLEGWGSTTKLYPLKQSVPWSIYSSVILVLNAHSAKLWLWCSWLITKLQLLYIKSTSIHIDINSYRHQTTSTRHDIGASHHYFSRRPLSLAPCPLPFPSTTWWRGVDSNHRSFRVRFTVWSLWPLGNPSDFAALNSASAPMQCQRLI